MTAVFEREIKAYFTTMTGYVFAAFLLVFAGIYTMALNLQGGYPNFEYVLANMSVFFIIAIPILTMRTMAEERRQKTDQLLYSLPISMSGVVIGKYLAMLIVIAVPVLIMCLYPLVLSLYGPVNLASAYASLLAFFLMTATLSAIGMFVSSLMENQAAAAGLCFGVMLLLYFMYDLASFVSQAAGSSLVALIVLALLLALVIRLLTKNTVIAVVWALLASVGLFIGYALAPGAFEGLFPMIMEKISIFERFYTFLDGVFDVTSFVYYISVSGLFLFFNVQLLEKRRWGE